MGTVRITGNAWVGQTLEADVGDLSGAGVIGFQWMRGTTEIGTGTTHRVGDNDLGYAITVTVTRDGYDGSITSNPTEAVVYSRERFTISFTDFLNIETDIIGPTVSILDSFLTEPPRITVLNPELYDTGSIRWFFRGIPITDDDLVSGNQGKTLVLGSGIHGNRIGVHFVTVEVKKDGVLFSKAITFRVVP